MTGADSTRGGADIFAAQASDPDLLAELYDLEHDEMTDDLPFYRQLSGLFPGPVLDLGCGSGRLLGAFFDGGAQRVVGVDGSAALLRRAGRRIAADAALAAGDARRRLSLIKADATTLALHRRFALVVAAGLLPHLAGQAAGAQLAGVMRRHLAAGGLGVVDDIGPGLIPARDLPLSIDWRRTTGSGEVVRRSQLLRREGPDGVAVAYSTLTDLVRPDGTITRLPASYRLWYPSSDALTALIEQAGLEVVAIYGSHDLEPLRPDSERRIMTVRRFASRRSASGREIHG